MESSLCDSKEMFRHLDKAIEFSACAFCRIAPCFACLCSLEDSLLLWARLHMRVCSFSCALSPSIRIQLLGWVQYDRQQGPVESLWLCCDPLLGGCLSIPGVVLTCIPSFCPVQCLRGLNLSDLLSGIWLVERPPLSFIPKMYPVVCCRVFRCLFEGPLGFLLVVLIFQVCDMLPDAVGDYHRWNRTGSAGCSSGEKWTP